MIVRHYQFHRRLSYINFGQKRDALLFMQCAEEQLGIVW